jgi:protein CpxP
MNPTLKHIAAAALVATFGLTALAQQAPTPQTRPDHGMEQAHRGMDRGQFRERMERRMAERQAYLKQKLALTPAQEGAWTAWTNAMKPPAQAMQRPNREEMAKLTTPERIDRMRAMRTERQAQMDKRMDATKVFYGALTADQKKVFDQESMRFMGGKRGGMGGHGGRHHG